MRRVLLAVGGALVVGAIAAGFMALGSPAEQRLLRLDERRVEDLRGIGASVNAYWQANDRLPDLLTDAGRGVELYRDPVSEEPYEYRVLGPQTYELCAEFARSFTPESAERAIRDWPHPAGRHCFTLNAEADAPR